MPNRFVEVPEAITLVDPLTNSPLNENGARVVWDFSSIINKLMTNPLWGESFAAMRSQDAICEAVKDIREGVLVLAEEDWMRLKQAVEFPRTTISTMQGPQVVQGFGLNPVLVRQIVRLLSPIVDAKAERPKPRIVTTPEATTTPADTTALS